MKTMFPDMEELVKEIIQEGEEERAKIDLDLRERVSPEAAPMKTAKKRSAYRFRAPNLIRPFAMTTIEVGLATVDGFGRHTVKFEDSFSNTPYTLYTAWGFFEIKIPIPRFEIRQYKIGFVKIRIPIPRIEWFTLHLPVMVFMTNVDKSKIEFFNSFGRANVIYFAMGE